MRRAKISAGRAPASTRATAADRCDAPSTRLAVGRPEANARRAVHGPPRITSHRTARRYFRSTRLSRMPMPSNARYLGIAIAKGTVATTVSANFSVPVPVAGETRMATCMGHISEEELRTLIAPLERVP